MKKYDIFISYRRSSYETANLIATRLKSAGYSVFFDMESLRSGKFNEQLFEVIDNCKDFVVVLPPNALDRCVNEDDWVRLEVCRAMSQKKNIVPVMLNGFVWPSPMPEGMEELSDYQSLTASSTEYFDMAMERLQKKYLQSKSHLFLRKWVKYSAAVLVSFFAVLAILWCVFYYMSFDACEKYATALANDASAVHALAEEDARLEKEWQVFCRELEHETNEERIADLQSDMSECVDMIEKNIKLAWTVDSVEMQISAYEEFLLSLHGINTEEMKVSPVFASIYFKDYIDQLSIVRLAISDPCTINLEYTSTLFQVFQHSINRYYASVLGEFATFPAKSLESVKSMKMLWSHFPNNFVENASPEYYENIVMTESQKAEDLMSRHRTILNEANAQLEDMQKELDKLEQQADVLEEGLQ